MKNVVVSSVAYMIVPLFMLGCSGQSKQSKEKDVITESVEVFGLFTDTQTSLLEYKATSSGKQVSFAPAGQRLNQQEGKEVYAL